MTVTRHSLDISSHHRHHSTSRKHRSQRDFADADLQRAIQLSLVESSGASHLSGPSYNEWQSSEPPIVDRATRPDIHRNKQEEDDDPQLKAAIEASLREVNAPKPSAPVVTPYDERDGYVYRSPSTYTDGRNTEYATAAQPPLPKLPNYDLHPRESDAILTFSQTVQEARAQGSSDLSRISNVHELYDRANGARPKLALNLDDTGRKEREAFFLIELLPHSKLSSQKCFRKCTRNCPMP
jgi:growth factor-regulated tyrosine kinase substrate